MIVKRCDCCDFPIEMCTRKKQKEMAVNTNDDFDFYRRSDRRGNCVCGQPFKIGDMIGWDKDAEWWRAENCCG